MEPDDKNVDMNRLQSFCLQCMQLCMHRTSTVSPEGRCCNLNQCGLPAAHYVRYARLILTVSCTFPSAYVCLSHTSE